MNKSNLIGHRFVRLLVIREAGKSNGGNIKWECLCDCGNTTIVAGGNLKSGSCQSCGCLGIEKSTIHGMTKTAEFKAWTHMKYRCYNKNCKSYPDWGGRGIIVCDRWLESFENFFADMGKKPSPLHSIDRWPDTNGNYEPSNCRWATKEQQANNKRNNRIMEYMGEKMSVKDLCLKLKISRRTLYNRINAGEPIDNTYKSIIVLDLATGVFYDSIKEAAISKNIPQGYLYKQLNSIKNNTSFIKT